jgi:hypothetical protein
MTRDSGRNVQDDIDYNIAKFPAVESNRPRVQQYPERAGGKMGGSEVPRIKRAVSDQGEDGDE